MTKIIYIILLIATFAYPSLGQNSLKKPEWVQVKFELINEVAKVIIDASDIRMMILSNAYDLGESHYFEKGFLTINYPVGSVLKYTILAGEYYLRNDLDLEINVVKNDANLVKIYLTPASERNLVIKGRVKDKMKNGIFGCKIDLTPKEALGKVTTLTDSSGFFQFVFENSNYLIGTQYELNISNPNYEIFDSTGTFSRNKISYLNDINLGIKPKPAKSGYIKFLGPKKILKSIFINSKSFLNEQRQDGLFLVTMHDETVDDIIKFQLHCENCVSESISLSVEKLVGNTYEIDLARKIHYVPKYFGIVLSGGMDFILRKTMPKYFAYSSEFGISKVFNINRKWFEFLLKISVSNGNFTETNFYETLPGKTGKVLNIYSVKAVPMLQTRYFFGNPTLRTPTPYLGLNGAFYNQRIRNSVSDEEISEELIRLRFFSLGINSGVRYSFNRWLAATGEISIDFLKLTNVNYKFNYFGRADISTNLNKQIKLSGNVSLIFNLWNI